MDPGELELRPLARPTKPAGWLISAAGWLIFSLAFGARLGVAGYLMVVVGTGLLMVPLVIHTRLWRKRARITLDGSMLTLTQARSAKVVNTEGGRVFRFKSRASRMSDYMNDMWLLMDRDGKSQIKLVRRAWGDAAIGELERQLGLPVEVIDKPMTFTQQRDRFPGSLPWAATHITSITIGTILGISVIIAAVSG